MGILRTDRVSGLGGASAIKGSVFFPQNSYINVEPDSDLDLSGDFTIEMWVYNFAGPLITTYQRQISSKGYYTAGNDGNWYFGFNQNSSYNILFYSYDGTGSAESVSGTCTSNLDEWYHIAASRSGSTLKLFVNGVEEASGTLSKGLDDGGNNGLFIGGISSTLGTDSYGDHYGYTSNIRIIKGRALYTAAFTPPAFELNQTSDTTLLCCQSSGNVLQEKTGKILSINNHYGNTNSQGVIATRFTPNSPVGFSTTTDVGTQFGSTFGGVTTFDSQAYFVPPGGNTRERNRGRAVMAGGMKYPTATAEIIETLEIQSGGMTQDFGDLTTPSSTGAPVSSSTRGVIIAGLTPSRTNVMEFVTIANTGNSTDFGDFHEDLGYLGGVSNETRGVAAGGNGPNSPSGVNVLAFVTIATTGNSSNFGDLSSVAFSPIGAQSSTRGLFCIGYSSTFVNTIEFITIATTGDATDFGDMSRLNSAYGGGCSSSTRALFAGGYNNTPASVTEVNNIDFVTIASTGNSTDFGDLVTAGFYCYGTSNKTRGIFQGRLTTAPTTGDPIIDSVIIASTGNAVEFGQMHRMDSGPADGQAIKRRGATTMSDSHGGLS